MRSGAVPLLIPRGADSEMSLIAYLGESSLIATDTGRIATG